MNCFFWLPTESASLQNPVLGGITTTNQARKTLRPSGQLDFPGVQVIAISSLPEKYRVLFLLLSLLLAAPKACEVLMPGTESEPQPQPKPQLWHRWILNPLCHSRNSQDVLIFLNLFPANFRLTEKLKTIVQRFPTYCSLSFFCYPSLPTAMAQPSRQ